MRRGILRNLQALMLGGFTSGPAPKQIPSFEQYVQDARTINAPATAQAQQIAALAAARAGIRQKNAETDAIRQATAAAEVGTYGGPTLLNRQPLGPNDTAYTGPNDTSYTGPTQSDIPDYAVDPYAGFFQRQPQRSNAEMAAQAGIEAHLLKSVIDRDPHAFAGMAPSIANKYFGQNAPSEQDYAVYKQRADAEAAQRANLLKWASGPGVTEAQKMEALAQHEQQYGDIINNPPPPSQADFARQQDLQERTMAAEEFGVPLNAITRDKQGGVTISDGWLNAQKLKLEAAKVQKELSAGPDRKDAYRAEMDLIKAARPDKPDKDAGPEDWAFYHEQNARNLRAQRKLYERIYGEPEKPQEPADPESGVPVAPAQYEAYQKKAQATGLPLVVDQDDYDDLPPNSKYIDAETGQVGTKRG